MNNWRCHNTQMHISKYTQAKMYPPRNNKNMFVRLGNMMFERRHCPHSRYTPLEYLATHRCTTYKWNWYNCCLHWRIDMNLACTNKIVPSKPSPHRIFAPTIWPIKIFSFFVPLCVKTITAKGLAVGELKKHKNECSRGFWVAPVI